MKRIILVGFGGHAKNVAGCINAGGIFEIAGYTDQEELTDDHGYPYLGKDDILAEAYKSGVHHAFVSVGYIGNSSVRDILYQKLKQIGYTLPVLVDPSAVVATDAVIGEGTIIGKCAVVNSGSTIGKMCIVNTGAIIEHESYVGDLTHIAVGTVLCGRSRVGHHSLVGANATVIQDITIGNYCIVGAGTVIVKDMEDGCMRYGNISK